MPPSPRSGPHVSYPPPGFSAPPPATADQNAVHVPPHSANPDHKTGEEAAVVRPTLARFKTASDYAREIPSLQGPFAWVFDGFRGPEPLLNRVISWATLASAASLPA